MKSKFPEYTDKMLKQKKKQAEKEQREKERQENKLPPFLMIRSGLFDKTAIAALILVPTSLYFLQYDDLLGNFVGCGEWFLLLVIFLADHFFMNAEKTRILANIDEYLHRYHNSSLLSISDYEYKRLAENIIKYKSKNDEKMFNRFIDSQNKVHDQRTATAIISGHLKSHPEDADKILEKFEIKTIPTKVLKLIQKAKQK